MASRRLFDGAQAELGSLPIVAVVAAGVTGAIAATGPVAVANFTGTFTPPLVSGVIAATGPVAVASMSGIVGTSVVTRRGNFFLLLGEW
jgi:hypothetical protein